MEAPAQLATRGQIQPLEAAEVLWGWGHVFPFHRVEPGLMDLQGADSHLTGIWLHEDGTGFILKRTIKSFKIVFDLETMQFQ